jgi:dTDP-4-amino-4,6-dideoxygalactose transaminase
VVEDAAHALPTIYEDRLVGGHSSDATVFSFYANKTLTTGEGGMIVSRNKNFLQRCRVMSLHGIDRNVSDRFTANSSKWRYDVISPGYKYNMTDVAAAMGREQLKKSQVLHKKRQDIVRFYDNNLSHLPLDLPPHAGGNNIHSWHLYIVQLKPNAPLNRDELLSHLERGKIGYSIHYTPLHRLTYWRELGNLSDDQFPKTTKYFQNCISLPIYPSMSDAEMERTVEVVADAIGP